MAKYEVNNSVDDSELWVLFDATARYLSVAEEPKLEEVLAILGIKESEEDA